MRQRVLLLATVALILVLGSVGVNAQSDPSISVDHIDGLAGSDAVRTDTTVTFHIRMNAGGSPHPGITNGFRVYSPTGATWTGLTADTTGAIGGAQFDLLWLINYYSITGSDADTVGFAGSIMTNSGMPADFDSITHTITMGPIDPMYTGGEICLDSSYYPPSGFWKWAGPPESIPAWDGPHCFCIGECAVEPPVITCPQTDPIELCGPEQICLDMPIAGYDDVTVTGGSWAADQFCFTADVSDTYTFQIIATNAGGADTCDVSVDVTIFPTPQITCPPVPFDEVICGPQQICVPLVITGHNGVTVDNLGTWEADNLCFNADTTGTYIFNVVASAFPACPGDDECQVTVNVDMVESPVITCPEGVIDIALCELGEICISLPIAGADEVVSSVGTWTDGQLCFTPSTAGVIPIEVTATNCAGTDVCGFSVSVDINGAPIVTSRNDTTITICESGQFCYTYTTDDPDGDNLSETLFMAPTGATIDTNSNEVCFPYDASGDFGIIVRVEDPCGAFAHDTVNVTIDMGAPFVFECPPSPIDINLCDPGPICVPFTTSGVLGVEVSYGTFSNDTLCFNADTSGTYIITLNAYGDCGEAFCELTFNVAIGAAPEIFCIEEPIIVGYTFEDTSCVGLTISGYDNVVVEHDYVGWDAQWSGGNLCFNTYPAGTYNAKVIATSDCGADTCDITIDVQDCGPAAIVCPPGPFVHEICGPIEICTELLIYDYDNVQVSGGTWGESMFCFTPDTAGIYTFTVDAFRDCSEMVESCELTFDITYAAQPVITCPVVPFEVLMTSGEICVPLVITDAINVVVEEAPVNPTASGPYWADGQLCLDGSVPGYYFFLITAENECGDDVCEVNIIITDCQPVEITCPPDTVEVMLCEWDEPCEVCVDLPISNAVDVIVSPDIGYWTSGMLCFWADTLGIYNFNVIATGGGEGCPYDECDLVVVVKPYVFECSDIILSSDIFYFSMGYLDTENPDAQYLTVGTSDEPFCFDFAQGGGFTWLTVPETGCTGDGLPINVNGFNLQPGHYETQVAVIGDPTEICEPTTRYFTVILDVLPPISDEDIIAIPNVPAVPGAIVAVPVGIENVCDLAGVGVTFEYDDVNLRFDSASFGGSVVEVWDEINVTESGNTITLTAANGTADEAPSGMGVLVTLWFKVYHDTPTGFYPITAFDPLFEVDCFGGGSTQTLEPTVIPGGVVVGTAQNYICGYVVDPDMNPIEDATVEYWADYPTGAPEATTQSEATGLFEFFNATISPFDLHAFKSGYYPTTLENLIFTDIGVIIVLTPIDEITITDMWVNFYCAHNVFNGEPFPIGTIIDAYDPDGVHCGTFTVTELGAYGFMPVYRDDPYTPADEGAEIGDIIRIYVNGIEANPSTVPTWTGNGDAHEICLDVGGVMTHSCDLMEGWNLVSWSVDTEVDDIEALLGAYAADIDVVLGFEQGGLTWDPEMPMFSTLFSADHLSGYWIKTKRSFTLEITGMPVPKTTPIPIDNGWNLISYLPDYNLNTMAALGTIHDNLVVALGFDGGYQVYQPGDDLHNTLIEMGPCNGYWVKVDHSGELVYPGAGPRFFTPRADQETALAKLVEGVTVTRNWVNLYASDLTLDGQPIKAGTEITAHNAQGNMIGRFELTVDGLFGFMPVYGVDETTTDTESINPNETFTLMVDGVETVQEFVWTAHAEQIEVGPLTAKNNGSGGILPESFDLSQNYPNPFNPRTTIGFSLPEAAQTRIEVFNILGRLVATPFDDMASAGYNEAEWDGRNTSGISVSSGIYFYRLTTESFTQTRKMTLLK